MQHKKRIVIPVAVAAAAVAAGLILCGGNSPAVMARVIRATVAGQAPGITVPAKLHTRQQAVPEERVPDDPLGQRVYKQAVLCNQLEYHTLAVYADPQKAMDTLLAQPGQKEFVQKVADSLGEPGLTAQNWEKFAQAVQPFGVCPEEFGGAQYYDQYAQMQAFFDVYENDKVNAETVAYLKAANHLFDLGVKWVSVAPVAAQTDPAIPNA